ncbi:MAG: phosphoribosylformylglycinamidine synthase subunit PurS [Calditrichaeota bacterium]|nr:phosphoribosylformylglycinamidine synthase subunit PurS [Calditrichota bacterium]RQW02478.1 MAG: phosphoribosylformylglycinamidine synthase subunit PurS [Calditrichota bacterium]
MKVTIKVRLKSGILDPQGKTVNNALHHLGLTSVQNVRIGKLIEFNMEEIDREKAVQNIEEACRKLLANPVIEDYSYEIEEG